MMLTPSQLDELETYAMHPWTWNTWVGNPEVTAVISSTQDPVCIGTHPVAGWFVLAKQQEERTVLYLEKEFPHEIDQPQTPTHNSVLYAILQGMQNASPDEDPVA